MHKILLLLVTLIYSQLSLSQSITSWTEENSTLGLGYPVPIPVDTPVPFDGFRTYAGLFAKHQMIEVENDYVTGHIIGETVNERDIWAYVLSDENNYTKYGVKEGVMMVNGNIHAREWQSPEVLTGIMELLHNNSNDESLHQFLLENTTIIALPVNNVDGLLQTQKYPTTNWFPFEGAPRDGRMRRKNMLGVDELLSSSSDYLLGVDLNRNNDPYWASSSSSSSNSFSIVNHGASAHSEPETLARLNAANLAPADQFRSYTDVHSYSSVHFSVRTFNQTTNFLQSRLMNTFTNHHRSYPAGRFYTDVPNNIGFGIGATDEYFAYTYQIPSWTLEIEPGGSGGVEYGGFGRNGHDGFILPESQITRVREQLAETFMVTWYAQSGPPSITQVRILDKQSQAIVYDAEWDIGDNGERMLYENKVDDFIVGNTYQMLVRFDKPMRMRDENGQVQALPGLASAPNGPHPLNPIITAKVNGDDIELLEETSSSEPNEKWINQKSAQFESYGFYKDDTFIKEFYIDENTEVTESSQIQWTIDASDMVSQRIDADPSTVVVWANGQWINYDDASGQDTAFTGGFDSSYSMPVSVNSKNTYPATVQNTGLYFDPTRNGEGFSYELLSADDSIWLQWFTYDENGQQRWYSDVEKFSGNTITINDLNAGTGGVFGNAFDSELISYSSFGDLELIFSGGEDRNPVIGMHTIERTAAMKYTDQEGNKLRTTLHQLSLLLDNPSDISQPFPPVVTIGVSAYTGSWYDPTRSGEGYIVEILENNQAVLLWYTYDLQGNHMWLIDSGGILTETNEGIILEFNSLTSTQGPKFGLEYQSSELEIIPWGTVRFELTCDAGTVSYNSTVAGFGSGNHDIVKLTNPINRISCE